MKRPVDEVDSAASSTPATAEAVRGASPAAVAEFVDKAVYEDNGLTLDAAFDLSAEPLVDVHAEGGGGVDGGDVLQCLDLHAHAHAHACTCTCTGT